MSHDATKTTPSIRLLATRLRTGQATAVETVERCLDTISRRDHDVNAFITVLAESARKRAREADQELARGEDRGPLHGVPISVKDLIDLEGLPTTAASKLRAGHRAAVDAPALARLRAAGVVFIGKCNLHELAFGTTGEVSAFGPTRNPLALGHVAGGSSSGSAASVAAGMALGSIGTDTGGSIRIPAAACGVVGLKPTFGEISCEGVVPLAPTLDHVGPLGRTVDDVATLYRTMTGLPSDEADSTEEPSERASTLAVPRQYFLDLLDDGIRRVFDTTLERLVMAGHQLTNVSIPHADAIASAYRHTQLYEAFRLHRHTLTTQRDDYSPDVRERLELGREVSDDDYDRAQREREILRGEVDAALDGVGGLILPSLAVPPPRLGTQEVELGGAPHDLRPVMLRLTQVANLTGHPAVSLPCGTTSGGLPCGVQLIGRRDATLELLDIAARCEATARGTVPT